MSLQIINPADVNEQGFIEEKTHLEGDMAMGSGIEEMAVHSPPEGLPPQRHWITDQVIRDKNPAVDLRAMYPRVIRVSTGITMALCVMVAVVFPEFQAEGRKIERAQKVIEMQDLPETRQIKRPPPPPRPAVPIETESADVPDDVTIETTDLAFDDANLDLPPPPPPGSGTDEMVEEEIVEFWAVEKTPQLINNVPPEYPEVARKAGLEGTVFVEFTVGSDGRVRDLRVVRGPQIFHEAALVAVAKFVFKPAVQNDKPVTVRMTQAIRFRLKGQS